MLVEADHALVLVVVPKNFDSLPLEEVYTAHRKGDWAFAIVEKSLEGRFHEVYGDLPWDEIWVVDLNDDLALEKALAAIRSKAAGRKPKPRPVTQSLSDRTDTTPWPEPDTTEEWKPEKKGWVQPRWSRSHSDLSDESLKKVQKSIRRMARSAF